MLIWRSSRGGASWLCALAVLLTASAQASAAKSRKVPAIGPGVSRALAVDRAGRISGVRYDLQVALQPHASSMPGHEVLRFTLKRPAAGADLPLDYRDGIIHSVRVNDTAIATTLLDGHFMLPERLLRAGENKVEIDFDSRVAQSGAAITRYEDKDDGGEYIYSLFVPMDASMAFPCFDQPDLKAKFGLHVQAPAQWTAIGNTAPTAISDTGRDHVTQFAETRPISTYLFAFTAGPWVSVHPTPGLPDVYVRRSQVKRAEPEVPQLQAITARGMAWLADYFQQPFPFPKYDLVLIPGFPFGGMEHAGATFLREDGVLFRAAPTASDRFGRNILTLHELTHQWFGDLVTMRWFDDLWLKEGFAQYMAYRALDSLEPKAQAWKHFYEDVKPLAYGIDETEGTTPIFQQIPNLKDAKSAYGAIVYQKAPSLLKQLEFRLGAQAFRDGLRLYLERHAYGNAQWSDLIEALHAASGKDVRTWADAWVLRRGMPEVTAVWSCSEDGRIDQMTLAQRDVLPDGYTWPISNELVLGYRTGAARVRKDIRVDWSAATVMVPSAIGQPCPRFVFANGEDDAYGRFLLDERSERSVREEVAVSSDQEPPTSDAQGSLSGDADPLLRSMLWGALWDNVHVAKSPPRGYVDLVLANLPHEGDETLARIQGTHAVTALHSYLTETGRGPLVPQMERVATDRMLHAATPGLRIVSFRTLTAVAETPAGRETVKELLAGRVSLPGVELRPLDRWNLLGRLVSQGDPEAAALFAAEEKRDHSGDGQRYAWAVQAGVPDAATKQRYFEAYVLAPTDPATKPEDWLTQSLGRFNSWNETALTAPYLGRALDQLPEIKRDRKIFFLGAWLGAFIGGQNSPEAEAIVKEWLAKPGTDRDLRLKVLENVDELTRTVRIRQRFPD